MSSVRSYIGSDLFYFLFYCVYYSELKDRPSVWLYICVIVSTDNVRFELLQEQDLCEKNRLSPAHYLKMKEVLMLESLRSGQVRRSDALQMFKVEPIKTDRVYELLLTRGWIQGDGPTAMLSDR